MKRLTAARGVRPRPPAAFVALLLGVASCSQILGIHDLPPESDAGVGGHSDAGNGLGGRSGAGGNGGAAGGSGVGGSLGTGGRAGTGGGGGASGTGGATPGSGGATGAGGGGGAPAGTGGSLTGTGGSLTGTGGASTGTGGALTGTGGALTGTGGSLTGTGGAITGTGGAHPGTGGNTCAAAGANVISNFEDGMGDDIVQSGRQGWWFVFADTGAGTQTPAVNASGPITVATPPPSIPTGDTAACDLYALHSTATGHSTTSGYVGFGTSLAQAIPSSTENPYDASAFDGIAFNIRSTSGTAPPIWFELLNTETQPGPNGTAKNPNVDEYNTRGMLLSSVGSGWTTVYVPFGLLAPRYLPSALVQGCASTSIKCQAPAWNAKSLLGLQFSFYPQFSPSTLDYDLWVDDVSFYTGSNGLPTVTPASGTAHPFPVDSAMVGSCAKPAGAAGRFLVPMYQNWKNTFVTGTGTATRVQRPEFGNDTISEGIGFGMLIAVYMGDKALFDALWSYEQSHVTTGTLMTSCVPGGSGSCSLATGSTTDADEDMAFALIQASKQWGGSYNATAATMISDIWSHDIDVQAMLPKGGSSYSNAAQATNTSYFAPAYYRVFATLDSAHSWANVASSVYTSVSTVASAKGLLPAWCATNCSTPGSNGGTDDADYQYDAHRVPWRLGLDACWNKTAVPGSGATFLTNNANFFATAATNGIGRVDDIYVPASGVAPSDARPNSMSAIGTAGVAAMAVGNTTLLNAAYQFLLDASYTADPTSHNAAYTYANATVGLLTALTMSGNFNSF